MQYEDKTLEELFVEIGEPFEILDPEHGPQMSSHWQCTKCKATTKEHPDLMEQDSFSSYGGTSEGYVKCTQCGASESWLDMSAIL